jgi:membrane associated rhomboid family serine protease
MFPIGDDNSRRLTTPFVVWALIAANAFVWYLQLTLGPQFTYGFSVVPFELTHGVDLKQARAVMLSGAAQMIPQAAGPDPIQLTLLSSMFMHGSWMHIFGNMLYLWIFGDQIEDLLGHGRFILFYLLCGLAAAFAQVMVEPDSVIPALGASGAIAGVLGAYLVRYPANVVRVLFSYHILRVPAFIVLGGWIALQLVSQVTLVPGEPAGVAYMAHIGGFVAGVVLVFIMARRRS